MNTLHIKRVTPRVIANRTRKPQIAWPNFQRVLAQELRVREDLRPLPTPWWQHQLLLWNKGYRGPNLSPVTAKLCAKVCAFPMGH